MIGPVGDENSSRRLNSSHACSSETYMSIARIFALVLLLLQSQLTCTTTDVISLLRQPSTTAGTGKPPIGSVTPGPPASSSTPEPPIISTTDEDGGGASPGHELSSPEGIAAAINGDLYFTDKEGNCVKQWVLTSRVVRHIAGALDGQPGLFDGPATSARFNAPVGLALSPSNDALYIADSGSHAVRKLQLSTGMVTTVAGQPSGRPGWQDGPARQAVLCRPMYVAVRQDGAVVWSDACGLVVRMLLAGFVSTVAGEPLKFGHEPHDSALFGISGPLGLAYLGEDLYITDPSTCTLRILHTANGSMSTTAGTGSCTERKDGQALRFFHLSTRLGCRLSGDIFIGDGASIRVSTTRPCLNPSCRGPSGFADGTFEDAKFREIHAMAIGVDSRSLYAVDYPNSAIREVDLSSWESSTTVPESSTTVPDIGAKYPRSRS
eukprot:gene16777-23053_t